jgi:hypothetical protein
MIKVLIAASRPRTGESETVENINGTPTRRNRSDLVVVRRGAGVVGLQESAEADAEIAIADIRTHGPIQCGGFGHSGSGEMHACQGPIIQEGVIVAVPAAEALAQ